MRNSAETIIQCPFFKFETKNLLCCEGFVDGTCMTTSFKDRKSALDYISDNCSNMNGGRCPLAMNLFSKYQKILEAEEKAEKEWREKVLRVKGLKHSGDNFIQSRMTVN